MTGSGHLVTLCGVDGVGKSSIARALRERFPDASVLCRLKSHDDNMHRLSRFLFRAHGDARDWFEGPFAAWMSAGLHFDFLKHYHDNIEPALREGGTVVCDRYDLCFAAYQSLVADSLDDWAFWSKLPRPDLCLYVTTGAATLLARQTARGLADDEHPDLSRRLDASYRRLLPRYAPRHAIISNDGDLPNTLAQVDRALKTTI